MNMTELERRCVGVAFDVPKNQGGYADIQAIVRAVLAEAGVADLVEALRDVQARITEAMDLERIGAAQALEEMAPVVNAALAKTGANQ